MRFPFVQDDSAVLRAMRFRPISSFLLDAFSPATAMFYRPLGFAYFAFVYALFGLQPAGFHILALLLLLVSAFLVVHIGNLLTGDARIAWGSGFVFVAAASIHLDTQMWLVGAFDIGATLSSLLCIALFLHRRHGASALMLGAALAFKESAVTLPLILVSLSFASRVNEEPGLYSLRALLIRMRLHALVFLIYAILKSFGPSLLFLPPAHPYAVHFFGRGVSGTLLHYGEWGLRALTPVKNIFFSPRGSQLFLASATAVTAAVFLLVVFREIQRGSNLQTSSRTVLAIALWFLLALFPAAALANHPNKYYMMIMLPPMAMGMMLLLKGVFSLFGRNMRVFEAVCVLFAFSNVMDGMLFIQRLTALGIREGAHATGWDGDNHLIRKASVVQGTWKPLLARFPAVDPRSVFVFRDVEPGCFVYAAGPQVWYGDSTLLVADSVSGFRGEHGNVRLALPPENPWNPSSGPILIDVPANRVINVRGFGEMMERDER